MRYFSRAPRIDWMSRRRAMFVISAVLIVGSLAAVLIKGLNFGIDFTGGYLVEVRYPDAVNLSEVRGSLDDSAFAGAQVQYFGTRSDVLIRLAPNGEGAQDNEVRNDLLGVLSQNAPDLEVRSFAFVSSQVGDELAVDGSLAMIVALLLILIYVSFRFEWKFSLGAVLALVHDAVVVIGYFAITGTEFDLTVLAAVLAVIGYSLNDSIVVFDRVRENFIASRTETSAEVINNAVNQTLARTINTGLTTIVVLTALLLLGGETIRGFATALIVGIVAGTYSSVFVASALTLMLGVSREDLLPPEQKGEIDDMP